LIKEMHSVAPCGASGGANSKVYTIVDVDVGKHHDDWLTRFWANSSTCDAPSGSIITLRSLAVVAGAISSGNVPRLWRS
jgi:hypothetical protein